MSRFADVAATKTVDLGPCECPGTPHESDWAKVRSEASADEVDEFTDLKTLGTIGAAEAVASFIPEWNLLGPDGQSWPPSPEAVRALKHGTVRVLADALADTITASVSLPNGSSAPSPASSRGSASRTRRPSRKPST